MALAFKPRVLGMTANCPLSQKFFSFVLSRSSRPDNLLSDPSKIDQLEEEEMQNVTVSEHAFKRVAQGKLSPRDIAYVIRHGRVLYRTGVKFFFLGWRDIPEDHRRLPRVSRLEGLTILPSHDGTLLTAYKNRKALRKIKRKDTRAAPYGKRMSATYCPFNRNLSLGR